MNIERYRFGEIIIDGRKYASDVIIYPDRVDSGWWRKQGHNLVLEDIKSVLEEKPEVLIVGTGASGVMRVSDDVTRKMKELGVELIVQHTDRACQEHNKVSSQKKTITCLHLTC
jgi:hypothetical protein